MFPSLRAVAPESFPARARNKNLNNFWKRPVNFHGSTTCLPVLLASLRAFLINLPLRKTLMEKTRILNDNHSDLRQKRSEPRSPLAAALHDEQTKTRILYQSLTAIVAGSVMAD
ncbi:MAG: hypothetical protein WBW41_03200 [Verrucomicrobiia bacterium]